MPAAVASRLEGEGGGGEGRMDGEDAEKVEGTDRWRETD